MAIAAPRPEPSPLLRTFVQRVRASHRRTALLRAALRTGLPGACLAIAAAFWSIAAALAVIGATLLAGLFDAVRTLGQLRRTQHAALSGIGARVFEDELRTWVERDGSGVPDAAMVQWLAADLVNELSGPAAPPPHVPRLRLGVLRYFVPVLVVLLLLWWLLPDVSLPLPGLSAPPPPPPASAGGPSPGAADRPSVNAPANEKPPVPVPPPPQPKPDPEPQQGPPPAPEPPAPLLKLPELPTAVVPTFVGDGPSRRAQAQVALVPGGGNGGATEPPRGGEQLLPRRAPQQQDFAAAAERAQQSRHVPPNEQALVRRYFELLQRGDK